MIWTAKQISEALNIKLADESRHFGNVQFNSKDVSPGDLFIALKGQRDGHEFVKEALAAGASCAIISLDLEGIDQSKVIKVPDCFAALESLAKYKRSHSNAKFVGVTGSVGKTSTKESLYMMLRSYGKTFASRGNFNNYLGALINLASMPEGVEYAVIEMGMNHAGEIREITKLVGLDVAIITSVAEAHLEFFESIEGIADAKSEIFESLDKQSGIAIINRDISTFARCSDNAKKLGIEKIRTFGESEFADYRLKSYIDVTYDQDHQITLNYLLAGQKFILETPLVPRHMAVNFAAAFAAVKALGLDVSGAVKIAAKFEMPTGRGRLLQISKNDKNYSIICDYYNSNPASMKAALALLQQMPSKHKVAILGDMRELGETSLALHKSMVPHLVKSGAQRVLLVGEMMSAISADIPKEIECHCYENVDALIKDVEPFIKNGELLLIKGSRGLQLDKLAEYLGVENAL